MEREVAERFERIEAGLEATTRTLKTVVETQLGTQQMLRDVAQMLGHHIDASDARMKRMEENLDVLIRAIAAEHANGRGKETE